VVSEDSIVSGTDRMNLQQIPAEQRFSSGKFYTADLKLCRDPQDLGDLFNGEWIFGRLFPLLVAVNTREVAFGSETYPEVTDRAVVGISEGHSFFSP